MGKKHWYTLYDVWHCCDLDNLQAQALSELRVECGNPHIITLAEEQLSYEGMKSIENPNNVITKKPVVYHSYFTKKRKIIFLADRYINNTYIYILTQNCILLQS